jgi:hypothetical protein
MNSGYEYATEVFNQTEAALADLQQKLVTARLLVTDDPLVADLDRVLNATDEVAEVIHEIVNSFWAARKPDSTLVAERESRWDSFGDALVRFQADAIATLKPTIREQSRFRRLR